jgi:hypothetical protein
MGRPQRRREAKAKKKGNGMKYLKLDDLFILAGSKEGEPFTINGIPATKAALLTLTLSRYQPLDGGRVLSMAELRSYNKIMAILEMPQENGYFQFEDADFAVFIKTVEWTAPVMPWCRQAPLLSDILAGAVGTLPAPSPDGVAKEVPEPVAAA